VPERTKGGIFIIGAAAGSGAATTRLLAGQGYPVHAGVHKDTGALRLELAAWDIPVCAVEPVAQAVLAAVPARKPRRRYTAGRGVRAFGILAHLPVSVRERLVASAFGLRGSVAGGQA
jgi:hypothetical protein